MYDVNYGLHVYLTETLNQAFITFSLILFLLYRGEEHAIAQERENFFSRCLFHCLERC